MKQFKREKTYKAKTPLETIAWARQILTECDLFVSENNAYFSEPEVASCRIFLSDEDISEGDFGTNGKGMNARYALASAYGEFMERVQNGILFGDYRENCFFNGLTKHQSAPDEEMFDASESLENAKEVLLPLLRTSEEKIREVLNDPFLGNNGEKMASVPFYDVFGEKNIMVPHKTLRMVIGSNGMAAGNTFKEAVTQGISEIYERAAVREAYLLNPEIRQIPPEFFKGNEIFDRLENLKRFGYRYRILDLSMGKEYPVLGLHLQIGSAVAFRAGADPCPVTALERCLTEMFQGAIPSEVTGRFRKDCCEPFPGLTDERRIQEVNDAEISYHVDETGKIADCLFYPSEKFCEDFAGTNGESEDADFEYMINLTKKLGLGLYIRDWSFLGFPAYQIIIPELSNYDLVYEEGAEVYAWSFEKTKFREDRCTKGCAKRLNSIFEKYEKNIPPQDGSMFR